MQSMESLVPLKASQCISTYTIELFKGDGVAPIHMEDGAGEIFGCDICQDVCPWNTRKNRLGLIDVKELSVAQGSLLSFYLLRPVEEIVGELISWSNKRFKRHFKGTAFERTGRLGLLKNLNFWKSKLEK